MMSRSKGDGWCDMGMSQRTTDFPPEGINDAFSTAFEHDTISSLEQLGSTDNGYPFGSYDANSYLTPSQTPSTNNDILPDFDFGSSLFPETAPYSNTSGVCQTPEHSGFNDTHEYASSLHAATCPSTPAPGTPHPYPIQNHHPIDFSNSNATSSHRPLLCRSATNNTHLRPPAAGGYPHLSRTNQPLHRRSLSQSEADRIAATYGHGFLTQHPSRRAVSATPDDTHGVMSKKSGSTHKSDNGNSRLGPYNKNARQSGQGPGHKKRRSNPPTSTPLEMDISGGPALVRELNPPGGFMRTYTSIGTPLSRECKPKGESSSVGVLDPEMERGRDTRVQLTGPRITRMSHAEQLRTSAKVIEIGAMAVLSTSVGRKSEQGIGDGGELQSNDDVLKLVDKMESHLKLQDVSDRDKGLRGCEMIREALGEGEGEKKGGEQESPHNLAASPEADLCLNGNDADLLTLLQNDLDANGFTTEGEH